MRISAIVASTLPLLLEAVTGNLCVAHYRIQSLRVFVVTGNFSDATVVPALLDSGKRTNLTVMTTAVIE